MKTLIIFLSFFTYTHASEIKVLDPCDGLTSVQEFLTSDENGSSIGQISIDLLDSFGISYLGDESGLASIFDTPTGDKSLVIVDQETLFAFGWCFSIDNEIPNLYPHEISFDSELISSISWFYAYSVNYRNEWVNMCIPAYKLEESLNPACWEK